jgi:hypothetical protein
MQRIKQNPTVGLSSSPNSPSVPNLRRPASTLPPFDVQKSWDMDSTPAALAQASRAVGSWKPRAGLVRRTSRQLL